MDDRVLKDLGPDERKPLAILARHGRDGRAITTTSLPALAGFGLDRRRLSDAIRKLAARGDHTGRRPLHRRAGGLPARAAAAGYRGGVSLHKGTWGSTSRRGRRKEKSGVKRLPHSELVSETAPSNLACQTAAHAENLLFLSKL